MVGFARTPDLISFDESLMGGTLAAPGEDHSPRGATLAAVRAIIQTPLPARWRTLSGDTKTAARGSGGRAPDRTHNPHDV